MPVCDPEIFLVVSEQTEHREGGLSPVWTMQHKARRGILREGSGRERKHGKRFATVVGKLHDCGIFRDHELFAHAAKVRNRTTEILGTNAGAVDGTQRRIVRGEDHIPIFQGE